MTSQAAPDVDWNELAPVVEDAIDQLKEAERAAVLLRFVERRTFGEIGEAQRLSEDAARKRVDRAVEKLRVTLGRRGIDSSAAALALTLTANAVTPAPAGLAAMIAASATAGAAVSGSSLTLLAFMGMTKVQIGVLAAVVIVGGWAVVSWPHAIAKREAEPARAKPPPEPVVRLRSETAPPVPILAPRAGTQTPAATTSRLRPMETLGNRGRVTPEDALVTLFWATWALDHSALGKMIAFAPGDRERVEAVFVRIPEHVRTTLKITSPEDLFAGAWALENSERYAALEVGAPLAQKLDPDAMAVPFEAQLTGEERLVSGKHLFRRTAEGWQWVVPTRTLDRLEGALRSANFNSAAPAWAKQLQAEVAQGKP